MEKYLDLKDFKFYSNLTDEDFCMPNDNLKKIKSFTEKYASFFWEKYISKTNRHFSLLNENEWPKKIIKTKRFLNGTVMLTK